MLAGTIGSRPTTRHWDPRFHTYPKTSGTTTARVRRALPEVFSLLVAELVAFSVNLRGKRVSPGFRMMECATYPTCRSPLAFTIHIYCAWRGPARRMGRGK